MLLFFGFNNNVGVGGVYWFISYWFIWFVRDDLFLVYYLCLIDWVNILLFVWYGI